MFKITLGIQRLPMLFDMFNHRSNNKLNNNEYVILDRSLEEDKEIFAEYFHNIGDIDERSFQTYNFISNYFLKVIPPPSIIVNCTCDFATICTRLKHREKEFDKYFPSNFLESIYASYENWIPNIDKQKILNIDSKHTNFLHHDTVSEISKQISNLLNNNLIT